MRFKRYLIIFLLYMGAISTSFCARSDETATSAKHWLAYEPAKVILNGTLVSKPEYGPPNYGENPATDEKIRIYVLHLDTPINVKGSLDQANDGLDTDSYTDVKDIQIVTSSDEVNLKKLLNKKIEVCGSLFEAVTAGNYTDVLIQADSIRALVRP